MAKRKPRRIEIAGSAKARFEEGRYVGPARKDEQLTVTLRLRRKSLLAPPSEGKPFKALDYDRFRDLHGADPADVAKVEAFAHAHGLDVLRVSLAQRAVDLAGTVAAMQSAFGTRLKRYTMGKLTYRIRTGPITVPSELAGSVEGVFGLDDRPRVRPYFRFAPRQGRFHPHATAKAFTALEVAALYNFPKGTDGTGQTIAILEFGGGYRAADLDKYFSKLGVKTPSVVAVSVGGAHNAPTGNPDSADGEVVLDIEIAGAVAPGARIVVYFAPNTDAGFINALYAAVHDNLRKPSVVSLSWGSPEKDSTLQSLQDYDAACVDAAALGITICAAAGDHGSADTDPPTKRAQVDFPASSPHVLACGGTHLEAKGGAIASETVWNSNDGWATGGGVSETFKLPDYQKKAGVPKSANPGGKTGRGVPDVAGNGDSATGYKILVDGSASVVGGTSAVAPLWAGLVARLNQGKGARLGFLHAKLYAPASIKGFHDIVQGNNGAYQAKVGWDPCTGLGSPDGEALRKAL
ncbi:MAG TPA: S53 family peptidase [Casimicrobiaceae bacterium]|nr:S53 family peptidase [Casimicrobiaceae bacterium]